jgi:hypothetical protein
MKLVIDRSRWFRGQRNGCGEIENSVLLRHGERCCLGFLGAACGIPDNELENKCYPRNVFVDGKYPAKLFRASWHTDPLDGTFFDWETVFAVLNDTYAIDEPTREAWLTEGFRAVLGVEVEFVDGAP